MTDTEQKQRGTSWYILVIFIGIICAYLSYQLGSEAGKPDTLTSNKSKPDARSNQHRPGLDFPIYEVDNMCRQLTMKQVNTMHWGEEAAAMIQKHCVREEQIRYNSAQLLWRSASEETRKTCLEKNDGTYHPYMTLEICLSGYFERDRINEQGEFQY